MEVPILKDMPIKSMPNLYSANISLKAIIQLIRSLSTKIWLIRNSQAKSQIIRSLSINSANQKFTSYH